MSDPRSEWIVKCEAIIGNNRQAPAKEILQKIMEVLESHRFVDTDWRYEAEPEGYFDEAFE